MQDQTGIVSMISAICFTIYQFDYVVLRKSITLYLCGDEFFVLSMFLNYNSVYVDYSIFHIRETHMVASVFCSQRPDSLWVESKKIN